MEVEFEKITLIKCTGNGKVRYMRLKDRDWVAKPQYKYAVTHLGDNPQFSIDNKPVTLTLHQWGYSISGPALTQDCDGGK